MNELVNQSINQLINQSIRQSINQSINQSMNQPIMTIDIDFVHDVNRFIFDYLFVHPINNWRECRLWRVYAYEMQILPSAQRWYMGG